MSSVRPPLRPMCIAAGLTSVVLTALIASYWAYYSRSEGMWLAYNRSRLEEVAAGSAPPKDRTIRVVGMGTSLLHAATLDDRGMAALASQMGIRARYVGLTRNVGGPQEWQGVIEDILRARPDFLVIEEQYLNVRLRSWPYHLLQFRSHVRRLRKKRDPADLWGGNPERIRAVVQNTRRPRDYRGRPRRKGRRTMRMFGLEINPKTHGPRQGCEETFAALRAAGIRVLCVWVPMDPREAARRTATTHKETASQIAVLARQDLVEPVKCPVYFNHAAFSDGAHMRSGARRRFSEWLLGELNRRQER